MPLIILSGIPCSGKSSLSHNLRDHFLSERKKNVHVVCENEVLKKAKNLVYNDSQTEKIVRGALKSEVTRLINNEDLVILDALNYIKGFRWDSPMFAVVAESAPPPLDAIHDALFRRQPPPPNQSTQLQPLSSSNFVQQLDKCTQEVVSAVLTAQKLTPEGEIKFPNSSENIILTRKVSLAELSRARRQFITYTKSHPVEDAVKIKTLFIQYLNKTLN